MDVVILHVLRREDAGDHGEAAWCAPALSPDERVVVWEGFAPAPSPDHPAVAPIVLQGELDGRRAYAERVPDGIRLSDAPPPEELHAYVLAQVLDGLASLHAARHAHGAVGPDRILLGVGGEVVLIGRGRRGGMPGLDIVAAVSIVPSTAEETMPGETAQLAAAEIGRRCRPGDRERLAEWARQHTPDRPLAADPIVLTIGPAAEDSADEVVPDLGPDSGHEGILDRWAVTTGGHTASESTPEVTAEGGTTSQRLARELWSGLVSLPEGPPGRFSAADGPSRALRGLLADEPPDVLPTPLVSGPLPAFVVRDRDEDHPTIGGDSVTLSMKDLPAQLREAAASAGGAPPRSAEPRRPAWVELGLAMLLGGAIVAVLSYALR